MRIAVITSSGASAQAADRRADAMARYLAARGDVVVRVPTEAPRLTGRGRIIPVALASAVQAAEGRLGELLHLPRHLPWVVRVAGHLRTHGPFDAVLAADAGLALAAATVYHHRQGTPVAVNAAGPLSSWSLRLLASADAVLVPDEAEGERLRGRVDAGRIHLCPTPIDPGLSDLRRRRAAARKALGLSQDGFVTLCPELSPHGAGDFAVREAAVALTRHGVFRFLLPPEMPPSDGTRPIPAGLDPLDVMAAADAVLLAPADRGASVPPGLVEAFAAGRPALLMADEGSPAARLVEEAGAGTLLRPADASAVRVAVFGLWADGRLAASIGRAGQRFVEAHHSVRRSGEMLARVLDGLPRGDAPGAPAPAEG